MTGRGEEVQIYFGFIHEHFLMTSGRVSGNKDSSQQSPLNLFFFKGELKCSGSKKRKCKYFIQDRCYPSVQSWRKTNVQRLTGKFSVNTKNMNMLISTFFSKADRKIIMQIDAPNNKAINKIPKSGVGNEKMDKLSLILNPNQCQQTAEKRVAVLEPGPQLLFCPSSKVHLSF